MKRILSGVAALLTGFAATAQTTTGTVRYQETISFSMPKMEGEAAQFAALLPKEQKREHVLYVTPEATLFEAVVPKKPDQPVKQDGIQINMTAPQEKYYTNVRDGQTVSLREFFGRRFLVTGTPQKQGWKMTGKKKTILNYPCQEAVMYLDSDTIRAWFTTSIPVSSGPRGLAGLPGLILASQEGTLSRIEAVSVVPSVPAGAITVPKGGKKVTDAQFKTIVDEKTAELGATRGPGGEQVILKIRRN